MEKPYILWAFDVQVLITTENMGLGILDVVDCDDNAECFKTEAF